MKKYEISKINNYTLNLSSSINVSDDEYCDGFKAANIASSINGTPQFNGELILRGKIVRTNLRSNSSLYQSQINALSKITSIDMVGVTYVDSCNFTRYCDNISEYNGLSVNELLLSELNLSRINFNNEKSVDISVIKNISYHRLKTALENGLKIKHFNLNRDLLFQIGQFLIDKEDVFGNVSKKLILKSNYTIDETKNKLTPLDALFCGDDVYKYLELGFVFKPRPVSIIKNNSSNNVYIDVCGDRVPLSKLKKLICLGCEIKQSEPIDLLDYFRFVEFSLDEMFFLMGKGVKFNKNITSAFFVRYFNYQTVKNFEILFNSGFSTSDPLPSYLIGKKKYAIQFIKKWNIQECL